jgi:hypothetical protein
MKLTREQIDQTMARLIMTPFLVLLSLSFCSSTRLKGINSVEDLEMDRQLKILNKPYIKSIEVFALLKFFFFL